MARSDEVTLLGLDEFARIMSIPGWIFNQVVHPIRHVAGCQGVVLQSGHEGNEVYYTGRDDVAHAIAVAESQIAAVLGFQPAPRYEVAEVCQWPKHRRYESDEYPILKTHWGHIIEFGVEAFDEVFKGAAVVYSDEDGDGVMDTGTITLLDMVDEFEDECEVYVMYVGYPVGGEWRIRSLNVVFDGDDVIITGPRWLFVEPDLMLTTDEVMLDDPLGFVGQVSVYRHYTDVSDHGEVEWDGGPCLHPPCAVQRRSACCHSVNDRIGLYQVELASWYDDGWVSDTGYVRTGIDRVYVNYLAGLQVSGRCDNDAMNTSLKEAIARLANIHMIDLPCVCSLYRGKHSRDNELMDVVSRTIARTESLFGTTARGAVFALSVLDRLDSIGRGG